MLDVQFNVLGLQCIEIYNCCSVQCLCLVKHCKSCVAFCISRRHEVHYLSCSLLAGKRNLGRCSNGGATRRTVADSFCSPTKRANGLLAVHDDANMAMAGIDADLGLQPTSLFVEGKTDPKGGDDLVHHDVGAASSSAVAPRAVADGSHGDDVGAASSSAVAPQHIVDENIGKVGYAPNMGGQEKASDGRGNH